MARVAFYVFGPLVAFLFAFSLGQKFVQPKPMKISREAALQVLLTCKNGRNGCLELRQQSRADSSRCCSSVAMASTIPFALETNVWRSGYL